LHKGKQEEEKLIRETNGELSPKYHRMEHKTFEK